MGVLGDIKAYLAEKFDIRLTTNGKSHKSFIKNKIVAKDNAQVQQNVFVLNAASLSDQERKDTVELLREAFDKGEVAFIEDKSKVLADSVTAAEETESFGSLVKFFEDKLKPKDWHILRTGLYIDYLLGQGMPTKEIRETIIWNHGDRGRNILNLASAGHFETHIKPLYEELSRSPDFTNEMFYTEFEKIVREMPFAIFVNSQMNADQLCGLVKDKIQQAEDYSVNNTKLYIHAWGVNVRTVEQCLALLEEPYKSTINQRKEVVDIIDVTIEF